MEFARSFFNLLRPKKGKKSEAKTPPVTVSPTTTQNVPNTVSPTIINNFHAYESTPESTRSVKGTVVMKDLEKSTDSGVLSFETSLTSELVWILSNSEDAVKLKKKALIGGYDWDGKSLYVIRTRLGGELLPGKLKLETKSAYTAWNSTEVTVNVFEVCCVPKTNVKWIEFKDGVVPPNAVVGGKTLDGEKLYIGRATYDRSLIPGKIQPSHKCCYVTFGCHIHSFPTYEVLCVMQ